MPLRIDTYKLDGKLTRASIGVRVPAYLARTGILEYIQPDGSVVREYRPPEEVFHEDSLQSWKGVPVTDGHPRSLLDEISYRDHIKGLVGDSVKKADDGIHVDTELTILDASVISAIEAGERSDISGGYMVEIEETSGEVNGLRYDRIQRNIRGNHVAVLPPGHGRSGRDVAIRLDSNDNAYIQTTIERGTPMAIRVDGQTYEDLSAAQAAIEAQGEKLVKADLSLKAQQKRLDERDGEISALRARVDELTAELATERDSMADRLDAFVKERLEIIEKAKKISPDLRCDGLSTEEIMRSALGDVYKDATGEYLLGAFTARADLADVPETSPPPTLRPMPIMPAMDDDMYSRLDAMEKGFHDRQRNAWKGNGK